jgi:glycerophosphoryl diester phosphodiesterase
MALPGTALLVMYFLVPLISLFHVRDAGAQAVEVPVPLQRAHAHNDYLHDRPLFDALAEGFCSIEADIHLVDGALLVAHDPKDAHPDRTLQALYLDPLRIRVQDGGGRVFANGPTVYLLIDIKTDAEATYGVLTDVLASYSDILTLYRGEQIETGAVTAVISGNRPREVMESEEVRYASYDGRLDDLGVETPAPVSFMPVVSAPWGQISPWDGTGAFDEEGRTRLERAVLLAHKDGRILRFWATPDEPVVWQVLYDAGVDLLNTDDLDGLQAFLLARQDP